MSKHSRILFNCLIILSVLLSFTVTPGRSATFDCSTVTEIPLAECQALVSLYNAGGGGQWSHNEGWLQNETPSSWFNVVVQGGHVTALHLNENHLVGFIPPEIGQLTGLTVLALGRNTLTGSIPPEIGNLENLRELYLINNQLTGAIPLELGNLSQLQMLDMGGNQLSGSLPASLGSLSSLTDLYIWGNQITGPIPPELGNLSNLRNLSFWGNQLVGTLPASLGALTNLVTLNLGQNQLEGQIPIDLANLANLTSLALHINNLSGPIPPELGNITTLKGLFLNANQLSGSIPPELGNLTNLEQLQLQVNNLSGEIPIELCNLTKLYELSLRGNNLTGSIPAAIGSLTALTTVDLRFNHLSGPIPPGFGNLTSLTRLQLGANQLSGPIPPELGNLTNLVVLALHGNHLSGAIPDELANLIHLADPGQGGWGMDGLALDYNWLAVPTPYPNDPPTPLQDFLMVKDPDWNLTQAVEETITQNGGEIVSNDNKSTLTIPPAAVEETTSIEYVPQQFPLEATGGLVFANTSFQVQALDETGQPVENFSFSQPITMTLRYTDHDIRNLFEGALLLYYWDETSDAWLDAATTCDPVRSYQRDPAHNTLSVDVCHFTEFALLGRWEHLHYLPLVVAP